MSLSSILINNEVQLNKVNLALKQPILSQVVASQAEMLALTDLIQWSVVLRSDLNYAFYQYKGGDSTLLTSWRAIGGTQDSIPSSKVLKVYTSGAIPTVDGLYAFAKVPAGGMPAGAVGDILDLTSTVWTVSKTFADADPSIWSTTDLKTYNKVVDGTGAQTWFAAAEINFYSIVSNGGGDKQTGFVTAQATNDDYVASGASIGICQSYVTALNESFTITANNFYFGGFGTKYRGHTQINKIIIDAVAHRITVQDYQISTTSTDAPLTINGDTGKGKHIFENISFSTTGTTAVNVVTCGDFINFKDCDFGNKIINLAALTNNIAVTFENCANGIIVAGAGYVINKINSPSVFVQSIASGSYILNFDDAKGVAYSLIKTASFLGIATPINVGVIILNDEPSGHLENLRCITAYTVVSAPGVGTALDLTKYDSQYDLFNAGTNVGVKVLTSSNNSIDFSDSATYKYIYNLTTALTIKLINATNGKTISIENPLGAVFTTKQSDGTTNEPVYYFDGTNYIQFNNVGNASFPTNGNFVITYNSTESKFIIL